MAASWWLRSGALVLAAGASIATQPPPSWTVSDFTEFDIELSGQAPQIGFRVTVTYDVPDDDTDLFISASTRIERPPNAGEVMTLAIDPDDGGDGRISQTEELGEVTFLSPANELDYCGRPCTRVFIVTAMWVGAPAGDTVDFTLAISARADGGDTNEVPAGADVAISAEPQ